MIQQRLDYLSRPYTTTMAVDEIDDSVVSQCLFLLYKERCRNLTHLEEDKPILEATD